MDELTEAAVQLLRRDGRLSFSEIARQLGTTRAAITARVTPLLETGGLRILAAVHPRVRGLHSLAHLSFRVAGSTAPLLERMDQLDSPVFISETVGPFAVAAEVHTRDRHELQAAMRLLRGAEGVVDMQVTLYEQVLNSFFLGAEPDSEQHLDDADLALIAELQRDGRVGYAELAAASGLSINGARGRVQRMLDLGIMRIGAVRQRSDTTRNFLFGLGITLHDAGEAAIELIAKRPGLEFLARAYGRFDLIATAPFASFDELYELLDTLRALDGVLAVDTWLHARIRRERYQFAQQRQSRGAIAESSS
ncbi:Lrp/AsnC family transcriptional regulator [Agrococcus sp. ProA11]|uniref:Lrp/AsnC family transcriptional regulator n=1 Tax=Agrococcus chionoecetis TaxID=3153752 RepID=UPI0032605561